MNKQMTKEENILLSEYNSICENAYMPSSASNVLAGRCTGKAIEYAKPQAIAFGEWLYQNYTQCDITDGGGERAKPLSKNAKTTKQLHSQFIEQQTKE
jgi:hypothetical protein